jgi:hypothetical protein
MTPSGTTSIEFTPIFDWSSRHGRKVSLVSFLAGSAVLHALCFYIFQIIYPPTVALLPPPARVNLITADSEQGRLLLRWVEAEDPALSSTTQRPAETSVAMPSAPAHVPSYLNHRPALKQLPPYQPDLSVPSAQPPGPVPLPRITTPSPAPVVATNLRFTSAKDSLGTPEIPSLTFTATTREPPATARFRIAVGAGGVVQYCFLDAPSGDPALDEQARSYLLLCRFPDMKQSAVADDRLLWTSAILEWGTDIAIPAPTSTGPAAP